MCFVGGGAAIDRICSSKSRLKELLISSAEALCLITWMYVIGYFGFVFQDEPWGYGFFSYNLLDFLDPTGYDVGPLGELRVSFSSINLWSSLDTDLSWEGFSYWGLGVLFIVAISSLTWITCLKNGSRTASTFKSYFLSRAFTFSTVVALFLLSLTHEFNIGHYKYFIADKFYVDQGLLASLAVVRSSARLAWPVMYLVIIGSICSVISMVNGTKRKNFFLAALLMCCIILQYADLKGAASTLRSSYKSRELNEFQQLLSDDVAKYKPGSLRLIHPESSSNKFLEIARVGSIHGVSTNVVYSARRRTVEFDSFEKCPNKISSIIVVPKDRGWKPDASCGYIRIRSGKDFDTYFAQPS